MAEEITTLIIVNYDSDRPTVMGRELHEALEIKTPYAKWFSRMCEYGFIENSDFVTEDKIVHRSDGTQMPQIQSDHQLTIPMAKEICMLQRTDKGKQIRKYFIAVEEQWNSPEAVMARALQIAKNRLALLEEQCSLMKPKADYYDKLVDSKAYTGITETAKELGVQPKAFIQYLLDNKYLYRSNGKTRKLQPYANQIHNGIFVIKEFVNTKNNFTSTQTFITAKGREIFSLVFCK